MDMGFVLGGVSQLPIRTQWQYFCEGFFSMQIKQRDLAQAYPLTSPAKPIKAMDISPAVISPMAGP